MHELVVKRNAVPRMAATRMAGSASFDERLYIFLHAALIKAQTMNTLLVNFRCPGDFVYAQTHLLRFSFLVLKHLNLHSEFRVMNFMPHCMTQN